MSAIASKKIMRGLDRSPAEQAKANLDNALRALSLVERTETGLCPHPIDIVRAEIRNAIMYLNATATE